MSSDYSGWNNLGNNGTQRDIQQNGPMNCDPNAYMASTGNVPGWNTGPQNGQPNSYSDTMRYMHNAATYPPPFPKRGAVLQETMVCFCFLVLFWPLGLLLLWTNERIKQNVKLWGTAIIAFLFIFVPIQTGFFSQTSNSASKTIESQTTTSTGASVPSEVLPSPSEVSPLRSRLYALKRFTIGMCVHFLGKILIQM